MRLLTRRKLYRAFPELDGYDDEHCVRFMRAAGKSLLHKLLTWLSMTTIASIGIAIAFFGALALARNVGLATPRNPDADLPLIGGVWLVVMLVCGTLMFWARDLLLWFRVGHVLRERGTCETCGYILVGLAIGPGNLVTCPECASETKVDESLGELVLDEQGRASFKPSESSPGGAARRIDGAVLRRRRRTIKWSVLGVVLFPFALTALYFIVLLVQALAARQARPTAAGFAALFPSAAVPANTSNPKNAWLEVHLAMEMIRQDAASRLDYSGWIPNGAADSCPALGGFRTSSLSGPFLAGDLSASAHGDVIRALDQIGQIGGWKTLSAALHAPQQRPPGADTLSPFSWGRFAITADPQRANLLEIGRMNLARIRGDPTEFAAAADDALQAAHILTLHPDSGMYVAALGAGPTWCCIIDGAHAGGPAWVEALYPVVRNAPRLPPAMESIRAAHVAMSDKVCWLFENPSRVWLERWSSDVKAQFGSDMAWPTRLGFYWDNARLVDKTFGGVERALASGMPLHVAIGGVSVRSNLALSMYITWALQSFANVDSDQVLQDGAIATIAIEKYNLDHGDYPATLQTLVDAGMLPALPIDPYSGKPLIYERAGPKASAHHAPYVLYSVGPDGNDDGLVQPDNLPLLPTATPSGHDFSFPILDEEPTP